MFSTEVLLVVAAVALRILVTAGIGTICAWLILRIEPLPYGRVFVISATAHILAKGVDLQLHLPLEVVALIPGAVLLILSFFAFKASVLRILAFWTVGLILYMTIHVFLSEVFGVTFLFSVWIPI